MKRRICISLGLQKNTRLGKTRDQAGHPGVASEGGLRQFPAACARFAKSNLRLIWRSRQRGTEGLVGHNGYGIVNIGLEMDPNGGAGAGKFPSSATGGLE